MYRMARNSTVRMIAETISVYDQNFVQYYEWDAHAEQFKLPAKDLFGLSGFSCLQHGQFHDITFAVGIMTLQDLGIGRMVEFVDLFYERLQSQARFPIYKDDGILAGFDCVLFEGTEASPMTRVDSRPAQTVSCRARLSVAGFTIPQ